jgi:ABC-2 type transport system ATP-binding protein
MDDVTALCPRVIVIDRGRLLHDGDLKRLVAATHPDKRITVQLAQPVEPSVWQPLVDRQPELQIATEGPTLLLVRVAPQRLTETVRALLDNLPVADLRVEDPPLEEVMVQIFGESSAARQRPSDPAEREGR